MPTPTSEPVTSRISPSPSPEPQSPRCGTRGMESSALCQFLPNSCKSCSFPLPTRGKMGRQMGCICSDIKICGSHRRPLALSLCVAFLALSPSLPRWPIGGQPGSGDGPPSRRIPWPQTAGPLIPLFWSRPGSVRREKGATGLFLIVAQFSAANFASPIVRPSSRAGLPGQQKIADETIGPPPRFTSSGPSSTHPVSPLLCMGVVFVDPLNSSPRRPIGSQYPLPTLGIQSPSQFLGQSISQSVNQWQGKPRVCLS